MCVADFWLNYLSVWKYKYAKVLVAKSFVWMQEVAGQKRIDHVLVPVGGSLC